jgi:YVTN family beta-propeller protein
MKTIGSGQRRVCERDARRARANVGASLFLCRRSVLIARFIPVIAALLFGGSAPAAELLAVEAKIPLGAVKGRIDHLAADLGRHRVFIAELGNNTLGVVDVKNKKVVGRITGLKEPQGVAYAPTADLFYVANGGDGSVNRYRGGDLSPAGTIKLSGDADNVRFDPRTDEIMVGYGGGALATLDAASGDKRGDIRLLAHPESFQLESNGARIFVNVPKAGRVSVIDRAAGREIAAWKLNGAAENFPMALDEVQGRLLVVYRTPPTLAAFDIRTGSVTRLPTCGDADDVFVDPKRHHLYVSCGEGAVAVIEASGDGYAELGRVRTIAGARTALFVPELDRLFLAVRASGNEPAALWVIRPAES